MELIYHYTSGHHLEKIIEKGELIVSEFEKRSKVKPPALWLSLNPVWENTVVKVFQSNSQLITLTKDELHEMFGLIRFVIEFKKETLCSWKKYRYKSNTSEQLYERMEELGIKQGASPNEWFASFKNIALTNCISCQKWNGIDWETITDDLMNFPLEQTAN